MYFRSYLNFIFLEEVELVTQWSKLLLNVGEVSLEAFQQVQTVTELIQSLRGSAQSSERRSRNRRDEERQVELYV